MIHVKNFQHLPNFTLSQLILIYVFVKYIKFAKGIVLLLGA